MKRKIVGLIVLILVFSGMLTTILVNSKYIFRSEPYYSESEVDKLCEDAYQQSIIDNSDKALYDKMSELTLENLRLKNLNSNLETEKETLQSKVSENENKIASFNAQIQELEEIKTTNENTIAELNSQIQELNSQIEILEEENNQLSYQILQKDATIEENNKIITQLQNSITYYEEYIAGLETESEVFAIFVVDNEILNIQKCNKNGLAYLEQQPTDTETYIFNGWKVNGTTVDLTTYQLTCNTTFVADLTYIYEVNFIVDDVVYKTQNIEQNGLVSIPEEPSKELYVFNGWTIYGEIVDLTTYQITENTSFVASFTYDPSGLFAEDGTLTMSWNDLISNNYISVSDTSISQGSNSERTNMTGNLIIPDNITSIGNNVFYGCSKLTSIEIPSSVVSFGKFSFYENNLLTNVIYHGTLSDWLMATRSGFNSNPCVYSNSLKIGDITYTFDNSFEIPADVTTIGDYAFAQLKIKNIDIPENVIKIGVYAFANCNNLLSVNMTNSVTSLGNNAFRNCSKLKSVKLSENIKSIAEGTFYYCSSLESIKLPSNVTTIWKNSFAHCSSLKFIYIPSSVTMLDYNNGSGYYNNSTFYGCSSLKIYCGVSSKPTYWTENWNLKEICVDSNGMNTGEYKHCSVYWGYTYAQYLSTTGASE